MSTSPDISIFVSRDWLPSSRHSSADLSVKRMGHALECFCAIVYLSYVRQSKFIKRYIIRLTHTYVCVCVDVNSWVGSPCVSHSITEA